MHAAAPGAVDPPTLELNVKIPTCHTQVAGTEQAFVVAAAAAMAAVRAHRCFFRRRNDTIRIFGSPNSPLSVAAATKPGKENNSRRLRPVFIRKSQIGRASCRERVCQYV